MVRRRSRIIVYSRQEGKKIEKEVVRRRSRIAVHNRHEKKYIKKKTKGRGGFY